MILFGSMHGYFKTLAIFKNHTLLWFHGLENQWLKLQEFSINNSVLKILDNTMIYFFNLITLLPGSLEVSIWPSFINFFYGRVDSSKFLKIFSLTMAFLGFNFMQKWEKVFFSNNVCFRILNLQKKMVLLSLYHWLLNHVCLILGVGRLSVILFFLRGDHLKFTVTANILLKN